MRRRNLLAATLVAVIAVAGVGALWLRSGGDHVSEEGESTLPGDDSPPGLLPSPRSPQGPLASPPAAPVGPIASIRALVRDERGQPVTDGVVVVSTFLAVAEGGLGAVDTTALHKVELKAGPSGAFEGTVPFEAPALLTFSYRSPASTGVGEPVRLEEAATVERTIVSYRRGEIAVRVMGVDDQPVPNVVVTAADATGTTDLAGEAVLAAPAAVSVYVSAVAPTGERGVSPWLSVVPGRRTTTRVVLQPWAERSVSLRSGGDPRLRGRTLQVKRVQSGPEEGVACEVDGAAAKMWFPTGQNASVRVELDSGSWVRFQVDAGRGPVVLDVGWRDDLHVLAIDADGSPVPGLRLEIERPSGAQGENRRSSQRLTHGTTDSAGEYVLRSAPHGEYRVTTDGGQVLSVRHGRSEATGDSVHRLVVSGFSTTRGRVEAPPRAAVRSPFDGLRLEAVVGDANPVERTVKVAPDGTWVASLPVAAGQTIALRLSAGALAEARSTVVAGTRDHVWPYPFARVVVRIDLPDEEACGGIVRLTQGTASLSAGVNPLRRQAEFPAVLPGTYQVSWVPDQAAHLPPQPAIRLDVPADGVEYSLKPTR